MYEKRLTQRLTSYWDQLRKEQPMPPFQSFNPSAVDDVWDYCMLLAVNDNKVNEKHYAYYQMGNKVKSLYGKDLSGQPFRPGARSSHAAKIVKRVDEVISSPQPLHDSGQFVSEGNKIVKFRSCMLPFGQNGAVTHIIVGLSWQERG